MQLGPVDVLMSTGVGSCDASLKLEGARRRASPERIEQRLIRPA